MTEIGISWMMRRIRKVGASNLSLIKQQHTNARQEHDETFRIFPLAARIGHVEGVGLPLRFLVYGYKHRSWFDIITITVTIIL